MDLDSAISVAAYVIQSLYDDCLDVAHWFKRFDVLDRAVEKWKKPCKRTLVHEYIEDLYLDSQNYALRKHFTLGQIQEMQKLLNNYDVDYSSIGDVDVTGMTDYDCPTDEMEEYADRLQDIFVDIILGTVVDDVFSILYMDKNFLYEFNRQCSEIIKY